MIEGQDSADELIKKLTLYFFKGSLAFILDKNEVNLMSWKLQELFMNNTINSELNKKYPISNKFIKLFIKKLLTFIEPVQEIHDHIYSYLCEAINNENSTNSFYYRHYLIDEDLNKVITMKETNNIVVNGTTGLRTWEAALILADWALSNKPFLNGKKILELGSGTGFTGVTIAKYCNPKSIILTDCHNDVLRTICDNIEINFPDINKYPETENTILFMGSQLSLGVMNLDWHNATDTSENKRPDVVIGADIVYDPSILQPLCNVLSELSKSNNKLEVYICSVIRNEETTKQFLEILNNNGFTFEYLKIKSNHLEWNQNIETCFLRILPLT